MNNYPTTPPPIIRNSPMAVIRKTAITSPMAVMAPGDILPTELMGLSPISLTRVRISTIAPTASTGGSMKCT